MIFLHHNTSLTCKPGPKHSVNKLILTTKKLLNVPEVWVRGAGEGEDGGRADQEMIFS